MLNKCITGRDCGVCLYSTVEYVGDIWALESRSWPGSWGLMNFAVLLRYFIEGTEQERG